MKQITVTHQYNDGKRIITNLSDGSEAVARNWDESIRLAGRIVNGEFKYMQVRVVERQQ